MHVHTSSDQLIRFSKLNMRSALFEIDCPLLTVVCKNVNKR